MTTDLAKLVKGAAEVAKLMLGQKLKIWVLLVPNHDSKDLNLHCAKKTDDLMLTTCGTAAWAIESADAQTKPFPATIGARMSRQSAPAHPWRRMLEVAILETDVPMQAEAPLKSSLSGKL